MLTVLARVLPLRTHVPLEPGLVRYAGSVLAELIDGARQQAIADGVRPIPATVSRALLGYFPSALLQRCRFATGNSRALTLPALDFAYGDANILTVGDVVLFKTDRLADGNVRLWAHELTHVMQFQRWGVDDFASRYVRDPLAVEQEAIDNADRFGAWQAKQ